MFAMSEITPHAFCIRGDLKRCDLLATIYILKTNSEFTTLELLSIHREDTKQVKDFQYVSDLTGTYLVYDIF